MTSSIIIPTYRREHDLDRLLCSISQLDESPDQIIVVIGPADQESLEVIRKHQASLEQLTSVQAMMPSVIHAMNLGFSVASGDVICLLDDDAFVPCDWLLKIKKSFAADPMLGAYGGRDRIQIQNNLALSDPPPSKNVGVFHWTGELIGNHHCGSITSPVEVDVIKGVNFSFRSTALNPLEIEKSLIGFGAEPCWEIDLCSRIKNAGYKVVYDNDNWVNHNIGERTGDDLRRDLFSPAWTGRTHNVFFVLAKYRSPLALCCSLIMSIIVGSRVQPGVIRACLLAPKFGATVFKIPFLKARAAMNGAISGIRSRTSNPQDSNGTLLK